MLIDRKADVNIRNNKNSTPLHLAAFKGFQKGFWTEFERILKNIFVIRRSSLTGRRKIAEILIANKADINAKNSDGKTPYDLAVQFGKTNSNL